MVNHNINIVLYYEKCHNAVLNIYIIFYFTFCGCYCTCMKGIYMISQYEKTRNRACLCFTLFSGSLTTYFQITFEEPIRMSTKKPSVALLRNEWISGDVAQATTFCLVSGLASLALARASNLLWFLIARSLISISYLLIYRVTERTKFLHWVLERLCSCHPVIM